MAFGTAEEMGESGAGCLVGIKTLFEGREEVLDGDASVRGVWVKAVIVDTGSQQKLLEEPVVRLVVGGVRPGRLMLWICRQVDAEICVVAQESGVGATQDATVFLPHVVGITRANPLPFNGQREIVVGE